ncbi:hypothetical protein SAMN02787118_10918 [Streptomyces mirabilis]|uniref:Uncharacterized protein n=1 Tax=Streptomyces mirabilis TaxID=68239 RepID=A0A1I2JTJ7_9ACTN|nr:hypothetical protein SAMN02787118_10918 [Streptomyces mirabilis]
MRPAAYGAVSLMAAADATGSPHDAATQGSITLASATGPIGHVLAEKSKIEDLGGRSVTELADRVLPALTAAMSLLKDQDPGEADNFRGTVLVTVEAAAQGGPGPVLAEMTRKITGVIAAVRQDTGAGTLPTGPPTAQGCFSTSFTEVGPNCLALAYSGIVMGLSNRKNDWFVPTVNSMYAPVVASKP